MAFSVAGAGETFLEALNLTLGLAEPRAVLAPITTDGAGNGLWTFQVPEGASGRALGMQSVQFRPAQQGDGHHRRVTRRGDATAAGV